jgi:hypothetical protein
MIERRSGRSCEGPGTDEGVAPLDFTCAPLAVPVRLEA